MLVVVCCWRPPFSVHVCEAKRGHDKGVRGDHTRYGLESHRYPQHALLQDIVLHDGATLSRLEWGTTVAVLRTSRRFWMPKGFLYRLSTPCRLRVLRAEPMMLPKDGYCGFFLNWDILMAWIARFPGSIDSFLEDIPAVQVASIVPCHATSQ